MPDRTAQIATLRKRIDGADYRVDAASVAESILRRPVARLLILPDLTARARSRAGAGPARR